MRDQQIINREDHVPFSQRQKRRPTRLCPPAIGYGIPVTHILVEEACWSFTGSIEKVVLVSRPADLSTTTQHTQYDSAQQQTPA